jgi:hypothetical protein
LRIFFFSLLLVVLGQQSAGILKRLLGYKLFPSSSFFVHGYIKYVYISKIRSLIKLVKWVDLLSSKK